MEASDGMLYGTTLGNDTTDFGGVFRIAKDGGSFSIIYTFSNTTPIAFEQGNSPSAAVIEATNGVLYGTAWENGPDGGGSIFKLNKDGSGFADLHDFTFATNDGGNSVAPLLQASDGELYGTAQFGGLGGGGGDGVVFRIDLTGSNFTVLHAFTDTDGSVPYAGLVEGTNGSLYGTTLNGGIKEGGVIFRIDKGGSNFSVAYEFTGETNRQDGYSPAASLLKGPDGLLYGTTSLGGTNNQGIAFSIDYSGSNYTVLHHFGGSGDGAQPYAGMVQGPDGALYGTTDFGGQSSAGTVYSINPDGSGYNVDVRFNNTNGYEPNGVITGSDGALYGTCNAGGTNKLGTIFKLTSTGIIDNDILNPPLKLGGTNWEISGHGVANRIYTILGSTNLALAMSNWTSLGTATADTNGNWQLNDPTNLTLRFYRSSYP